jgi:thiol-disulfide isomerase/thioredoxin
VSARTRRFRAVAAVAAVLVTASLALAGCTSSDGVAGSYTGGDYTSGDGATTVIAAKNRSKPISYEATTATGSSVTSAGLLGKVVVINFWYAQCGPCIAEAPRLEKLDQQFTDDAVQFLGVNINDLAPQALQFQKEHAIAYPTTIETGHNSPMRFAFSGKVSPTTTPTTLVIDREGRVAARFSGEITKDQASVLGEVIQTTLDEKASGAAKTSS